MPLPGGQYPGFGQHNIPAAHRMAPWPGATQADSALLLAASACATFLYPVAEDGAPGPNPLREIFRMIPYQESRDGRLAGRRAIRPGSRRATGRRGVKRGAGVAAVADPLSC